MARNSEKNLILLIGEISEELISSIDFAISLAGFVTLHKIDSNSFSYDRRASSYLQKIRGVIDTSSSTNTSIVGFMRQFIDEDADNVEVLKLELESDFLSTGDVEMISSFLKNLRDRNN